MDDRGKALAKSRAELRPLGEWFWDALDASAVGSRNAAARLAGYNKNIAYAAFEGQQLIKLVQARELAEALDADLAETEKLWYTARRALGALASADDQAQAVSAEESLVKPARRLRPPWTPIWLRLKNSGIQRGEHWGPSPALMTRRKLFRPKRVSLSRLGASADIGDWPLQVPWRS